MNSTCQISTTEATGTIIGLKKKVRNVDLPGMRASSSTACASDSTTASGTASAENSSVFFAAIKKAEFDRSFVKLSRKTKFRVPTPSIIE